MITLETKRILLREIRESDLDEYARMCADDEMMQYIGQGNTLTRAEAWRSIAFILGHWRLRGYGMWTVEEKQTGMFLGRIGFYFPHGWPELEVGWWIGRHRWGEGFATEGGQAAIRWGFEHLKTDRICSIIQPQNSASIRVAEKLGESFLRKEEIGGVQAHIFAVAREEFFARFG